LLDLAHTVAVIDGFFLFVILVVIVLGQHHGSGGWVFTAASEGRGAGE
jgi:hypothetical protein